MSNRTFLILLLLLPSSLRAQNESIEFYTDFNGQSSIVREWRQNSSIVLAYNDLDTGYFLLVSADTMTAHAANIPFETKIFDFKILDDTVYFCGNTQYGGLLYTIVGWFSIYELFYSGGAYHYSAFMYSTPGIANLTCQMIRPERMAVYRHNNTVHIAAIGESRIEYHDPRTSIMDVRRVANDWTGHMYYNKDGEEYYTDITATDNYVIATACDSNHTGCHLHLFSQSASTLQSPLFPGHLLQVNDDISEGIILAKALDYDNFAIANYFRNSTNAGSTVKILSIASSPSIVNLIESAHYIQSAGTSISSSCKLQDIGFCSPNHSLYLLQDMDYPISSSPVSSVNIYNTLPSLAYVSLNWTAQYNYSIDQYRGQGLITSGDFARGRLTLHRITSLFNPQCSSVALSSTTINTPYVVLSMEVSKDFAEIYHNCQYGTYIPTIRKTPKTVLCK